MELAFSREIFVKSSNFRFHENPSSESRVVLCGQTDKQTRTDMTKLIVAFRNSANAPKYWIAKLLRRCQPEAGTSSWNVEHVQSSISKQTKSLIPYDCGDEVIPRSKILLEECIVHYQLNNFSLKPSVRL